MQVPGPNGRRVIPFTKNTINIMIEVVKLGVSLAILLAQLGPSAVRQLLLETTAQQWMKTSVPAIVYCAQVRACRSPARCGLSCASPLRSERRLVSAPEAARCFGQNNLLYLAQNYLSNVDVLVLMSSKFVLSAFARVAVFGTARTALCRSVTTVSRFLAGASMRTDAHSIRHTCDTARRHTRRRVGR